MKTVFVMVAMMLAGQSATACPELSGRYSCGLGLPGLSMTVDATTTRQGDSVTYSLLGYTIVADGHEQRPSFNVVLRGNTFTNVVYTATCNGKALTFQARGHNVTKGVDAYATGVIQPTPRGQIAIHVNARWGGRSIKTSALCRQKR